MLLFEDEVVGLCMHLRGIPLITCSCFYDWGPCNIGDPSSCKADTANTTICRLPLTVHKLKSLSWYDGWWQYLSGREQASISTLDEWELLRRSVNRGTKTKQERNLRARSSRMFDS